MFLNSKSIGSSNPTFCGILILGRLFSNEFTLYSGGASDKLNPALQVLFLLSQCILSRFP